MRFHEYQAKEILKRAGLHVPVGDVASDAKDAPLILSHISSEKAVVKAQIHAGGRGKAGGVRVVSKSEVQEAVADLLEQKIVTAQTGPAGRCVRRVLIEEALEIEEEFYTAILVDRDEKAVSLLFGPGGVEVESEPHRLKKLLIDPTLGLVEDQAVAFALSVGNADLAPIFLRLYALFVTQDCSLLEINPLIKRPDGFFVAADAKMILDDNALFRHSDLERLRDLSEEEPSETIAREAELSFVKLNGPIACMVNGAGLAMATMDLIAGYGLKPANFLDVGGRSTPESIAKAVSLILGDPEVKVILVNIFGGIVRCDHVARGIISAMGLSGSKVPVVVRLTGTNEKEGRVLLEGAGYVVFDTMDEATKRAVSLAREGN